MYRVLLVQNLSEMRNYAYADARSTLQAMGFDYELFTMENTSDLSGRLLDGSSDLLFLASNCLNDVVVKDYLIGDTFRNAIASYLAQGKPCLILHQNGIANMSPENPFLVTEMPYQLKSNYKTADGIEDLGYNYFLNALKASKLHYIIYREDGNPSCQDLFNNIRLGLHSTLLIPPEAKEIIKDDYENITAQGVKIIEIKNEDIDKKDSYLIHATEKNIRCAFAETEVKIQRMLLSGFINGSFMKTIDVLKILMQFQQLGVTKGSYNKETLGLITSLIEKRIKPNGSFDDTSLASVKALWYYKNIVGENDPIAKKLENYVTTYTRNYAVHLRELVEELKTTIPFSLGGLSWGTTQQLRQMDVVRDFLADSFNKQKRHNEYDVLAVLEVAGLLRDTTILKNVLAYLESNLSHGLILNTHLTATFTTTLIEQYNQLPDNEPLKGQMQNLLFEMVAYLKRELDVLLETDADDKYIDTTLHIVQALYAFETIVSFPITDLINLVFRSGNYPNLMLEFGKSIADIQQTRLEVNKYKDDITAYKNLRSYRLLFYVFAGISVVLLYASASLLMTAMNYDSFWDALKTSLLDAWPTLFSAAIIPFLKILIDRIRRKDK